MIGAAPVLLSLTRRRHPLRLAKPLIAAFALGSMVALRAHAELDVATLKQSIETSFESEYPKLDALYKELAGRCLTHNGPPLPI
jgi:hypothetical protein